MNTTINMGRDPNPAKTSDPRLDVFRPVVLNIQPKEGMLTVVYDSASGTFHAK